MCSGLADVCDRALVQCAAARPSLLKPPPQREPDLNVLEWAGLAEKCELQTFGACCELFTIDNFPLVRRRGSRIVVLLPAAPTMVDSCPCVQLATKAKLVDLNRQSLLRILIGVYCKLNQGTNGLQCPSCPSTAQVNRCGRTRIWSSCLPHSLRM